MGHGVCGVCRKYSKSLTHQHLPTAMCPSCKRKYKGGGKAK